MKQKLAETIDRIPPGHLHPKVQKDLSKHKQRLFKLAELIDDLGRLDERSQEVFVDENSLRKLVREVSPGSEDAVVEKIREIPGSKMRKGSTGMKPIPWETLSERLSPTMPKAPPAGRQLGPYSKFDEIRGVVKQQFPDIPDDAFEPDKLKNRFQGVLAAPGTTVGAQVEVPTDVWDCMVRTFGFWGAVGLVAAAAICIAAFIIVSAAFAGEIAPLIPFWDMFWMTVWNLLVAGAPWIIAYVSAFLGGIMTCVLLFAF
jgi:hypothetical protein